ncbi:hypothetical protein TWF970_002262 [Orbilia oligospora]|uniref:Uncharacterized protein n=1 Tax=Orbilia oligospora TaxID=2813651 RepID=A0A7C8RCD7_ORBOL|nr:hypothetical protein TWF970_002262 [Orbilia oligospora]
MAGSANRYRLSAFDPSNYRPYPTSSWNVFDAPRPWGVSMGSFTQEYCRARVILHNSHYLDTFNSGSENFWLLMSQTTPRRIVLALHLWQSPGCRNFSTAATWQGGGK